MRMILQTSYVGTLRRHLLTEPDINIPYWTVLANVASTTNENSIRPYAGVSAINQFQGAAASNLPRAAGGGSRSMVAVQFTAAYTCGGDWLLPNPGRTAG